MTGAEYNSLLQKTSGKAHEMLFDEYYSYVRAIAFNRLHFFTNEDIEECISDIFAEVFFSLNDGNATGELKGYIGTIAKRKCIDCYRRLSRNADSSFSIDEENAPEISSGEDPAAESERSEVRRILMECIKELGTPDSIIMIQKFYYNKNSQQISRLLSMKPSAVRMRCKRAADKLKEALAVRGIKEDAL